MGLLQPLSYMGQKLTHAVIPRSCTFRCFSNRQVALHPFSQRAEISYTAVLEPSAFRLTTNSLFNVNRRVTTGVVSCRFSQKPRPFMTFHSHKRFLVTADLANICTQTSRIPSFVLSHTMSSGSRGLSSDTSSSHNGSKSHSSGQDVAPLSDGDAHMMQEAREIFYHAVSSVLPHQMIGNRLQYDPSTSVLKVDDHEYKLHKNVHVVGFGKAVLGMARAVEDRIGAHIVRGLISIPVGAQEALRKEGKLDMLLKPNSKICVREGAANNLPDQAAFSAAKEITAIVEEVGDGDVLIVLISGGGSALLPAPKPPVTLDDMLSVTRLMSKAGASIVHLNTVRKQTDLLKGGGLARLAHPAQVISLILSDVIGDPLDFIASGPTVPDLSTPKECLDLFSQLGIMERVPPSVINVLQENRQGKGQTSNSVAPKSDSDYSSGSSKSDSNKGVNWSHVQNLLVGTNKIACNAVCEKSSTYGYLPYILSTELDGEAKSVGKMFAHLAHYIAVQSVSDSDRKDKTVKEMQETLMKFGISHEKLSEIQEHVRNLDTAKHSGVCIVAGGETTVNVRGDGKGGRNQEMAVCAALELDKQFSDTGPSPSKKSRDSASSDPAVSSHHPSSPASVVFLSGGTDGQDGPTTAAGGVVSINFASCVQASGLSAEDYLERNDTHTLLAGVNDGSSLVVTGLTGTNVMDIHVLLVKTS